VKFDIGEFLSAWFVILLINQVFIFGACFYPNCIIAALPHTGVIAYFWVKISSKKTDDTKNDTIESILDEKKNDTTSNIKNKIASNLDNSFKKDTLAIFKDLEQEKPDSTAEENTFKNFEAENKEKTFEKEANSQNIYKSTQKSIDPLKAKGDAFEKYIGKKFEEKNEIVIYNGFIRGYEDAGVDIISICKDKKTINLIQCKNWTKKTLTLDYIIDIYTKLSSFNFDFRCSDKDIVCKYLQSKEVINKLNSANILDDVYYNYNNYTIRKTLYISSDKVVDLNIGQELKMMKENIFRYKDMKIVIRSLGGF